MGWQDTCAVTVITRGTRDEILAGDGLERVKLRWPATPKLTPAELAHADALMAAWDARQTQEAA